MKTIKILLLIVGIMTQMQLTGQLSVNYKYDANGQIIQTTYNNQVKTIFTYDPTGNRIQSGTTDFSGLENENAEQIFNIYPNPVRSNFFKIFIDIVPDKIEFLDITGRSLPLKSSIQENGILVILPEKTPAGIYICKITSGKGINSKKILKQN